MLNILLVITFTAKLAQSNQNIAIETETQEFNSPIISNEAITPMLSSTSNKVTFCSGLELYSGKFDLNSYHIHINYFLFSLLIGIAYSGTN